MRRYIVIFFVFFVIILGCENSATKNMDDITTVSTRSGPHEPPVNAASIAPVEVESDTAKFPAPPATLECTYPDDQNSPAPAWICNPSLITGRFLAAVGSGKSQNAFLQKQQCLGSARTQMAQMLSVFVKVMFHEYAESTDSRQDQTLDQMSKAVTEQLTQATLVGTHLKKSVTSPKGTYYCLVSTEKEQHQVIANAATETAISSQGKEWALWQTFQDDLPIDEMSKKITDCSYPDDPKSLAPAWICNPSIVTGELLGAVGSGKNNNVFLQKQRCLGAARVKLAQLLETKQYAKYGFTGQHIKVILEDSKAFRWITSPKGMSYCLVGMPKDKWQKVVVDAAQGL